MADEDRRRFIWRKGVLGCGLPMGLFWAVAMPWLNPFENRSLGGFWIYLATLPIWFVAGYLFGMFMWPGPRRR